MRDNRGVTFVELIVCIAILSFLLVAVVGMVSSNTAIFRKEKGNVTVQDDSREIVEHVSEVLAQAETFQMVGWKIDKSIKFNNNSYTDVASKTDGDVSTVIDNVTLSKQVREYKASDFTYEEVATETDGSPKLDEEGRQIAVDAIDTTFTADDITNLLQYPVSEGKFKYYRFTDSNTKYTPSYKDRYYPKRIVVTTSVPYEKGHGTDLDDVTHDIKTTVMDFEIDNGRCVMYEFIRYKYMTAYNTTSSDYSNLTTAIADTDKLPNSDAHVFTDNLNFAYGSGTAVPGFQMRFDVYNNSIDMSLEFLDKGMPYSAVEIARFKNKNVLYNKSFSDN